MKLIYLITLTLLLGITLSNPQRRPWSQKWSQDYIWIDLQKNVNTTGKLWYDWTLFSMRQDFDNSLGVAGCRLFLPQKTSCSILVYYRATYIFYPQKRLCYYCGLIDSLSLDHQSINSKYVLTKRVGDQDYHEWQNTLLNTYYMTTTDQKQIYFRQWDKSLSFSKREYFVNSYTENINSSKIFNIPHYCKMQIEANSLQKEKIKEMIQHNLKI